MYESFNSPTISFHVFFADNDGWHLTAVDLLSTDNHKGACYVRRTTDVNKGVHCVRAGQFTTGPRHTREDCTLGGAGATLSVLRVR